MDGKKKRPLVTGNKTVVSKRDTTRYSSPTAPQMDFDFRSSTSEASVPSELLVDFFECPVCRDYALPPIYQCNSGHLICSVCRPKCEITQNDLEGNPSPLCPTCRQPLETIRNMALEKMSSLILFPCKFSTFGCTSKFSPAEKSTHENKCRFKVINCPTNCEWMGSAGEVIKHISRSHNEVTTLYGSDIIFLAADVLTPAPAEWLMVQESYDETFLIVFKKMVHENRITFYAYTVTLGIQLHGKKFAYRLALNADDKRLSWEAVPKSILDESAVWETECFKMDMETVLLFAKNRDLSINVVVSLLSDFTSETESEDDNGLNNE